MSLETAVRRLSKRYRSEPARTDQEKHGTLAHTALSEEEAVSSKRRAVQQECSDAEASAEAKTHARTLKEQPESRQAAIKARLSAELGRIEAVFGSGTVPRGDHGAAWVVERVTQEIRTRRQALENAKAKAKQPNEMLTAATELLREQQQLLEAMQQEEKDLEKLPEFRALQNECNARAKPLFLAEEVFNELAKKFIQADSLSTTMPMVLRMMQQEAREKRICFVCQARLDEAALERVDSNLERRRAASAENEEAERAHIKELDQSLARIREGMSILPRYQALTGTASLNVMKRKKILQRKIEALKPDAHTSSASLAEAQFHLDMVMGLEPLAKELEQMLSWIQQAE